jgi:hypothetical protein
LKPKASNNKSKASGKPELRTRGALDSFFLTRLEGNLVRQREHLPCTQPSQIWIFSVREQEGGEVRGRGEKMKIFTVR